MPMEAAAGIARAALGRLSAVAAALGGLSAPARVVLAAAPAVAGVAVLAVAPLALPWRIAVAACVLLSAAAWHLAALGAAMRERLHREAAWLQQLSDLPHLSRAEFTLLVSQLFAALGYAVRRRRSHTDFDMQREGRDIRVRCHAAHGRPAATAELRAYADELRREAVACAYFVSTEPFDAEVAALAAERDIALIDGTKLEALLEKARGTAPATRGWLAEALLRARPAIAPPQCPRCGSPTRLRTPRRRRRFWGCSCWPVCKGRRELTAHEKAMLPAREGQE